MAFCQFRGKRRCVTCVQYKETVCVSGVNLSTASCSSCHRMIWCLFLFRMHLFHLASMHKIPNLKSHSLFAVFHCHMIVSFKTWELQKLGIFSSLFHSLPILKCSYMIINLCTAVQKILCSFPTFEMWLSW